jgi:hypothetical protein
LTKISRLCGVIFRASLLQRLPFWFEYFRYPFRISAWTLIVVAGVFCDFTEFLEACLCMWPCLRSLGLVPCLLSCIT